MCMNAALAASILLRHTCSLLATSSSIHSLFSSSTNSLTLPLIHARTLQVTHSLTRPLHHRGLIS
jgi:hypothetical protein